MFKYHHIYTFFASSGIANQIFECRILRRYDELNKPDWVNEITEPRELTTPKEQDMTIDWARGNDVYTPMLGSKFDFTLVNTSGSDFLDFADGDFKEFRVDVINLIPDGSIIYNKWGNGRTLNHYSVVQAPKIAETTRPGYKAQLYWRGFVHPVNSKEPILAPPFNVKYTAVDGLAELGERIMPFHTHNLYRTDTRELRLIEVIQYALEQTKVDLDLAVNSGIVYIDEQTNNGEVELIKTDTLIHSYVSVDAFTNEKLIDVVKGILSAFNCRLVQSNGYWYILNPSLINSYNDPLAPATGITWKIYEYDSVGSRTRSTGYYEKEGSDRDTDKQLRRSVNGQRSDLIPMESTLAQTIQQPAKSFECTPNTLHSANMMQNEAFDFFTGDEPNNWTHYDDKVPPGRKLADLGFADYVVDPLKLASTKEYAYLQSRALESNRLIAEINSVADIWAIGTTHKEVLGFRDATISIRGFAWFTDAEIQRVNEQPYYEENEIFGDIAIPFSVLMETIEGLRIYDFEQNVFLDNDGITDSDVHFDNAYEIIANIKNKTQGNPNQSQYVSRLNIVGGLLSKNTFEFESTSVDINVSGSRFSTIGKNFDFLLPPDPEPKPYVLQVVLWYPQTDGTIIKFKNDPDNGYPNDNNIVGKSVTLIDSVQVTTKIPDDVLNPTFTRIQTPFRRKESYSPYVVHETDFGVAQKIYHTINRGVDRMFRLNTFHSVEELDDNGNPIKVNKYRDTDDSLEQITTQLKLNDFRRRTQVFEGDVASNHNGYPLFPVQTIDIDFNSWKSGRTPREQNKAEATVFWGGRYNLSTGLFSISTFTPNQFTDISPENRSDISSSDFDDDGQLKPGYYTNRPTAFETIPDRIISGGEAPPEPEPEPEFIQASWFRYESEQNGQISSLGTAVYTPLQGNRALTNGRMKLTGYLYVGSHRFFVDDFGGNIDIDIPDFIRWDTVNNKIINTQERSGTIHTLASLRLQIYISNMFLDETIENLTIICENYDVIINPRIDVEGYTEARICEYVTSILGGFDPISGDNLEFGEFSSAIDNDLRFAVGTQKIKYNYNRFYLSLHALPIASDGMTLGDPTLIAQAPFFLTNDGEIGKQTSLNVCLPVDTNRKTDDTENDIDLTYSPTAISGKDSGNVISGSTTVTVTGLTDLNRLDFEAEGTLFMTDFNVSTRALTVSILRSSFPSDKTQIQREIFPRIDGIRQVRLGRPLFANLEIEWLVLELNKTRFDIVISRVDVGVEDVQITRLVGLELGNLSVQVNNLVGVEATILSESGNNIIKLSFDGFTFPASPINSQNGTVVVRGETTIEGFERHIEKTINISYDIAE